MPKEAALTTQFKASILETLGTSPQCLWVKVRHVISY